MGRTAASVLATAALGACASAHPEIGLPEPRASHPETTVPNTERLDPIERGPRSVVRGTIGFLPRGTTPVDLGATVVSLRPTPARPNQRVRGGPTIELSSETARFAPPTHVVRPGQPVVLRNGGPLVHRLFTPEVDDRVILLDPGHGSEPLSFQSRGPARFYCSLHADETFVVFVEDAPHVSVVSRDGSYRFGPVAPGRYTLAIWSERVSGPVRQVYITGYSRMDEPIWLVSALIDR